MPTKKNIITFLADDDLLRMIDDYRRTQDSIPSRSEVVRVLVEKGLKISGPPHPKPKKK
jgi:metal-responsive CopG/Arc/MetJ family transcriptional regulator